MTQTVTLLLIYALAGLSLVVGTGGVYLALIRSLPTTWLYYHYFARKPVTWVLLGVGTALAVWAVFDGILTPPQLVAPLLLLALGLLLAHRLHQESVFVAIDFPPMAENPRALPLDEASELALIEHGSTSRAYPLDFVIHHHVLNDRLGDRIISLTYCAMCRTVMAFDVTELGPLFVGSFKNANMIVADRRTKTFFQQATCESIIGPRHPHSLELIPSQILTWSDVLQLVPMPQVADVKERDLVPFELPLPGLWRRITSGEATPGLPSAARDKRFSARTRVIGIMDPAVDEEAYLKRDVLAGGVVGAAGGRVALVGVRGTVNAFRTHIDGHDLALRLSEDRARIEDDNGNGSWDLRGHPLGETPYPLQPVAITDEYWFSWRLFHPEAPFVRLGGTPGAQQA
ncbi:MAG: DUF3179 domain-containing (seleno)protein [Myxococcota bacterium]